MTNRYRGYCEDCSKPVKSNAGKLEKKGPRWVIYCSACFDKSDNSSQEDRCCGDRAYEDQCAERCGY